MDEHHSSRPDAAPEQPSRDHRSVEARRRMLRRSLGLASPVVLTLASAPVSAGTCITASGFVSANAHASLQPRGAQTCHGQSPDSWKTEWERSAYREKDRIWRGLSVSGTHPFHSAITLGAPVLSSSGFSGTPTLFEVLSRPTTIEAYVTAAWLNAQRYTDMPYPFNDAGAIKAIWANIAAHGGYYAPGDGKPDMTRDGTFHWLELTWQ